MRSSLKKIHFVGIKGVGQTALAVYMKQKGIDVSGSDTNEIYHTDEILKKYTINVKAGFSPHNIPQNTDLIITTGAHDSFNNPESLAGIRRGIRTITHGQALGEEMKGKVGISVAGTHGKTTTTSMIATIAKFANLDPSYVIGTASIPSLGAAGHYGRGNLFIAEADEYITAPNIDKTPRFLWQSPRVAIITSIEYDHPDAYQNIEEIEGAFFKFATKVSRKGLLILGIDDSNVLNLKKHLPKTIPTTSYGFSDKADYKIVDYKVSKKGISFVVINKNLNLGEFNLQVPGTHNAQNATAAAVSALFFGLKLETIKNALVKFSGSKRRFEKVGNLGNILLYDDYAHHPSEIEATLKAFKDIYPNKRIMTIFQPHTYSRTYALFPDFVDSFLEIQGKIVVTDIFASKREKKDDKINAQKLVDETRKKGKSNIFYFKTREEILLFLEKNKDKIDIILTMGAGDIYKLHEYLKK